MAELLDGLTLWGRLTAARIRAQLQYRTSFALDVLGNFLISFLDFAVILVIFANVPQLGGWSVAEVALLYGIACLSFALADLLVGELDQFPQLVRDGGFDLLLIRPRGSLFQVVTTNFQLRRVGKAIQALGVLVLALGLLDIAWTPERAAMLVLMVPAATVLFVSVWVAAICIVFWTVEGRETANAFTYGGNFLTQFPLDIYDRWLRQLLVYVVPLAFISYLPAAFLLGKPDPLGLPSWLGLLSPLVAAAAAAAAGAIWGGAVRHYRSAGG